VVGAAAAVASSLTSLLSHLYPSASW
jgi:hypothetical protein